MERSTTFAAFTEEQAARLAHVSQQQLRYWDTTDFFKPSMADPNRRLKYSRIYSFVDVVGLRTLGILINEYEIPTRYLRKVRETLKQPQELWADTTLYILGKRVYLQEPDSAAFREPTSGQLTLKNLPLRRVIGEVEEEAKVLSMRGKDQIAKTSRERFVSRNSRVISGTRIPVSTVKSFIEEGYKDEEILEEFPSLTAEDIQFVKRELRGAA